MFNQLDSSGPSTKKRKLFVYSSSKSEDTSSSSTLSYVPKGSDEEIDDNDELIDIDMMTMNKPSSTGTKLDFSKADGIVENAAKMDSRDYNRESPQINSRESSQRPDSKDSNTTHEEDGDIVQNMLTNSGQPDISVVEARFKSKNIPNLSTSKIQLQTRIGKYLELIPQFLDGSLTMSFFYDLAKVQRDKVPNDTLRQRDKYMINWDDFTGGYYGLNRQFFIASVILSNYKQDLVQKSKKNSTLSFWGIEDFCKFILANEIIIRLVMEDYKCDLAKAEEIVKTTAEYGRVVSDSKELDDDLESKSSSHSNRDKSNDKKGKSLEALFGSD